VAIGRIFISLPRNVVIENIYVEDRTKDTLISAGSLKAEIGLLKLIFKGEININKIELGEGTAKIRRELPDTVFNFQFIADAFAPSTPAKTTKPDTSSAAIAIPMIRLDKIRLVYKDVITGNNITAWVDHFATRIDKMDPAHLRFDVPETDIEGLTAQIHQFRPLTTAPAVNDTAAANPVMGIELGLKKINLRDITLDYSDDVAGLSSNIKLGSMVVKVNKLDLNQQRIDLQTISLDNTIANLRFAINKAPARTNENSKAPPASHTAMGWRITIASIKLDNNTIAYDDDNEIVQQTGIDYAHLKTDSLTLNANDFLFSNDTISGDITSAQLREKSGLVIEKLETEFLYTNTQARLKDLYLKTPGTELKKNAAIQYASLQALQNDIGNMRLDAAIENSRILVRDVLIFAPSLRSSPAFADPNATWYVNSRIRGRVSDMQIDALQIEGLQATKINISGRLAGLPQMKAVTADLNIREISSTKKDIDLFMPAGWLPGNITFPGRFTISGKANGTTGKMNTAILAKTDLGNMTVNGEFHQLTDPVKISYDASVQATALDIGTIFKQQQTLGLVTASFTVKGKGTDIKTTDAVINGKIESATIEQYIYHNLDLNGSIANQHAKLDAGIVDPNIHFALTAEADLSKTISCHSCAGNDR